MGEQRREEIVIDAPLERVYDTITDYERYPEFLPENQAVTVLERDGDTVKVRFEVEMVMRVEYTLSIVERAPDRVEWTLVDARMLSENKGGWSLERVSESQTRAVYTLDVALTRAIPAAVSERLTGQALPKTLQRFKERAEREDA